MSLTPEIKAGNWYFGVRCWNCHVLKILGEAPAPDSPQGHLAWAWPVSFDCDCGTHIDRQPGQIGRWQALKSPETESSVVFHPQSNT